MQIYILTAIVYKLITVIDERGTITITELLIQSFDTVVFLNIDILYILILNQKNTGENNIF